MATKKWGAGSVTTSMNKGKIEVLRILWHSQGVWLA
jgi:hypothetical protein